MTDTTLGTTIGNLGFEQTSFPAPVFIGDTLTVETEVVAARASKSRPDRGIVTFEHRAHNQRGELVCRSRRPALMMRRPPEGISRPQIWARIAISRAMIAAPTAPSTPITMTTARQICSRVRASRPSKRVSMLAKRDVDAVKAGVDSGKARIEPGLKVGQLLVRGEAVGCLIDDRRQFFGGGRGGAFN